MAYGVSFPAFTTADKDTRWFWIPGGEPGPTVAMAQAWVYRSRVSTHDHGNYMDPPGSGPNEARRHFAFVRNDNFPSQSTYVMTFTSVVR
jgi:hypothetical protein